MAITNRYKDIIYEFIDNSDTIFMNEPDFPDWLRLIDNELHNISRSIGNSSTLLKEDHSDDNISVILLELVSTI